MSKSKHYNGLSAREVEESRARHGVNVLTPPEKIPLWKRFLEKFEDPIIIILLIAGVFSLLISCYEFFGLDKEATVFFEPVGIFVAVLLSTGLAFYFELKANQEFEILNQVNDEEPVRVIREGNTVEVPKCDIVVGDIVMIGTGDDIPADAELLESVQLTVDESTLTGEPLCAKTTVEADFDAEATFSSNHVLRGTKVMAGHGICRVLAVGDATESGKVFEAAQIDDSVKTPLNEQLDRLSSLITNISYVLAVLIIVGRVVMYFVSGSGAVGFQWVDFASYLLSTIMIAVTVIVVAVPEGLPMAVTLSLAYSMRRMFRTGNLVRKMHACETMGATTVICTDKTGTLTQNRMTVAEAAFPSLPDQQLGANEESGLIAEGIAVNSTATLDLSDAAHPSVLGNPTEGALLLWLHSQSRDYRTLREASKTLVELPFATERKYMAAVVESGVLDGRRVLYVKGAPEIVRSLCVKAVGDESIETLNERLLGYQRQTMRTLGFAYQVLEGDEQAIDDERGVVAKDLTYMGTVAIADPVRPDVPEAVGECLSASIDVKIVTGDTSATAAEIGRQIGLWGEHHDDRAIITGPEFEALSDEEVYDRVNDLKIIARARPLDKKRLVETLQKRGQVVAVTGDGTNDAPALKTAHVGLSMGDGTSVAKEASDITITDNSFSSIGRAVMWGRSLYQNIQRFILFQMTVNVAACFIVLAGAFMGTDSPLTVTQMLWVNLIMDTFAAMALASLPPAERVMHDKPRDRNAFIIDGGMKRMILVTGGIFFLLLLGFVYVCEHADVTSLTDLCNLQFGTGMGLSALEKSYIFTFFVMLQFWNMFNARAYLTGQSAFHFKQCKSFLFILLVILVGQILIVTLGGRMFNVTPLSLRDWAILIGSTSVVLWIGEAIRLFRK